MPLPLDHLGGWRDMPFFDQTLPGIEAALQADGRAILPPARLTFAALEQVQPDAARVVILGQDPYPTAGHANGLAFSVAPGVPLPRSLRNIFRELSDDLGAVPPTGDLGGWADQGVLLLNTALTVPDGCAGGHARLGWSVLARQVLTRVSQRPCAFVLWGRHAAGFREAIGGTGHLIVESAHPSPLSATRGFFGSRPFSRVNAWLEGRNDAPIDWQRAAPTTRA